MRVPSILPALAFLLSASSLVEAGGGFGGSCRDNQIWRNEHGWHLSSVCRRYDGSEGWSSLKLSNVCYGSKLGQLRWGPDGGFRDSIEDTCDSFGWLSAGEVMKARCREWYFHIVKDTNLHLNDHIYNDNGRLVWDGYKYMG